MKKTALILALFAFASCESIKDAIAPAEITAAMSLSTAERGIVNLDNLSANGGPCNIDWGDGKSDNINSMRDSNHRYNLDGTYTVKLTVYNTEKRTKEKTTTQRVTVTNTEGDVIIYLNANPQESKVMMGIDGVIIGYPTKYLPAGSTSKIDCSTDAASLGFGINKKLKPGKHSYEAYSIPNLKSRWSGTFEITNNACTIRRLVD